MLNKVILIGRLTRDPEGRFLPSGTQVASFSLAVNRAYKVNEEWKEETYYFDMETMGNLAERIIKQFNKGDQVLIEGELRQDRWETNSGEKRSKVKIFVSKINRLSSPKKQEETQPVGQATNTTNSETLTQSDKFPDIEEVENESFLDDDDVPF